MIKKALLISFLPIVLIGISGCECPTSGDIDSISIATESTEIMVVDATGGNHALTGEIADIVQFSIPERFEQPFRGRLETGRQILSIDSDRGPYFTGPVITQPNREYLGILSGELLFGSFTVMATDTLPGLSVFNASGKELSINGIALPDNKIQPIESSSFDVDGRELNYTISSGMIVIFPNNMSEESLDFVEISY